MSTIKTFGTVAIMVACFAVIYPRFMHPLVLRAFGLHESSKKDGDGPLYPPSYKSMHPERHKKGSPDVDEMRKHMRAGPHPGMRAAAEMQRQQAQQGSGRGMMGVVLPMYAIGIVLYLVYTLFKVFNKSKTNTWTRQKGGQYGRGGRGVGQDRMGFPLDCDGSGDVRNFLNDQDQRKELEDLLTRVDDKNVSTEEMRVLQKRLEETEAQMTRILQAMQSVQNNVDQISADENIGVPQKSPTDSSKSPPNKQASEGSKEKEGKQQTKGDKENLADKTKANDEKMTDESSNPEGRKESVEDQKRNVDLDGIDKDTDEENENDATDEEYEGNDNEDAEEVIESGENNGEDDLPSSVRQRKVKSENEQ